MNKFLIPFFIGLVLFTSVFFGLQYLLVEQLKETNTFFYNTWSIYMFHFFATFFVFVSTLYVHKTYPDKAGFAFMICSLLKMFASILFLFPLIQIKEQSVINDVIAFFVPYFLFLIFETFFVLRVLNKK